MISGRLFVIILSDSMMSRWHDRLFWLCVLAFWCSAGTAARSATVAPGSVEAQPSDWVEVIKNDIATFPDTLAENAKTTFLDRNNMAALLGAGFASVAMHNGGADDHVAEHFERHSTFHGCKDETLNIIGSSGTHGATAFLWYLFSRDSGNEVNRQCAEALQRALTLNTISFYTLKAARHNDTPNGKSWAWPSGHTSSSFTVASVLHEFYGLKVGIPAYAAAGLVAYRMMDTGDHWASDVAFGATLGWVVGHTVAKKYKGVETAGFEILPYFGNYDAPALGISLARRF